MAQDITELCRVIRPIIGKIIEIFKGKGGNYIPHRPTMAALGGGAGGAGGAGGKLGSKFGAIGGRNTSARARTFAGRKTMML